MSTDNWNLSMGVFTDYEEVEALVARLGRNAYANAECKFCHTKFRLTEIDEHVRRVHGRLSRLQRKLAARRAAPAAPPPTQTKTARKS